ncbi:MAG: NAD(P)H-dependent glycerol-3-phosphate dehydrogenase [Xanthobacteraceae bacterium]
MSFQRIAVIGAGAWGSALANTIVRAGRDLVLVARDATAADAIRKRGESRRLPGIAIDPRVAIVPGGAALQQQDAILLAVPAQHVRAALVPGAASLRANTPIIACAKGIEQGTELFMTQVIDAVAPGATAAILSGPSFALDVARGLPTAVTLAAPDHALAKQLAHALGSAAFRVYHSSDVRGVEIGGAAKNVLAIAAGIVAGRSLGPSAVAALVTRGFAELLRLGTAFGAQPQTLTGLSGLGDLILTCSSAQSRNYSFGLALAAGHAAAELRAGEKLAEGVFTAPVLMAMGEGRGIDMPITRAVCAILGGRISVDEAIETLLSRPFRAETA